MEGKMEDVEQLAKKDCNNSNTDTTQQSINPENKPLDIEPSKKDVVDEETVAAAEEGVRRGQRTRRLTEKGKEQQEEKCKGLQHRFTSNYTKWKAIAKEAKRTLKGPVSGEILKQLLVKIDGTSTDVKQAYEDLRQCTTPDGETRRRVDTCHAVSTQILGYGGKRLEEENDESLKDKPKKDFHIKLGSYYEGSSLFSSVTSSGSRSRRTSQSSVISLNLQSKHGSQSSTKIQEAAAELAANQVTLVVLEEMEREAQALELQEDEYRERLVQQEAENRERVAQQEAENAKRVNALEEKRRLMERLETIKKIKGAKARLQIYEQEVDSDEERAELLKEIRPKQDKAVHRPKQEQDKAVHRPKQEKAAPNSSPAAMTQMTTRGQPDTTAPQEDGTMTLAQALAESINASRLPVPEPSVFSGDPLKYRDWKMSFQTLIGRKNIPVNEKVYYLRKYVGGPAKRAIESYFLIGTDEAYHSALKILEERYGSSFVIATAFREKLTSWPKIGPKDSVELREYSDFLRGCQAAMSQIKSLEVLNDCGENQRMLTKLPDWLTSRWNRKVIDIQEATRDFPSFGDFVEFVAKEAKIACNPVTSLHALKSKDGEKEKTPRTRSIGAKVLASSSEEKPDAKGCVFCEMINHGIHKCRKFMEKSKEEKVKFVQTKKLCFGCLKPGHHSKKCEKRSVCATCEKKHPTCLHEDRANGDGKKEHKDDEQSMSRKHSKEKERSKERAESKQTKETTTEVTTNRVVQDMSNTYASTVVPVWLSTTSSPEDEVLVYALLDNQSDTTFILQERAEALDTQKEPVQLKLSTLSAKGTVIQSQKLTGLQVRGFYSSKKIPLPVTYTREFIPANMSHIPSPKTARAWAHLEYLAEDIAPLIDCDIGLLIGYNCSQALLPREIVSGRDNEPFAQRTDLGWSIVGCVNPCVDYGDAIGSSHRIFVKEVTPSLQSPTDSQTAMEDDSAEKVADKDGAEVVVEEDLVEGREEEDAKGGKGSQEEQMDATPAAASESATSVKVTWEPEVADDDDDVEETNGNIQEAVKEENGKVSEDLAPTAEKVADEDGAKVVPAESEMAEDDHVEETNGNVQEEVKGEKDRVTSGKRTAESSVATSPSKKIKLLNDGFCLFVGNLNTSKTFEEVKDSLVNFFTTHSLPVDVRLDHSRKYAYVDFHTEEDLTKALEFNGEKILDKKMRIGKAKVHEITRNDKEGKDARTLFVKNIPYSATKEDLQKVFDEAVAIRFPSGKDGPSKGIAFVEFKTESVAAKALEEKQGTEVSGRVIVIDFLGEKSDQKVKKTPAEPTPTNILIVNNLPYAAKEKTLKKHFKKAVGVRIPQTKNKPRGYAFIEFESEDDAREAMESSQKKEIGGRAVRIEFGQLQTARPEGERVLSKTLIVMGLAEKTSEETLKSAFEGAICAHVITDKDTAVSRGFGFVDFENPEECNAAKEAMEDCEIDGCKVTVKFAKPRGTPGAPGRGSGGRGRGAGFRGGRGGGGSRGARGGGSRGGRGGSSRGGRGGHQGGKGSGNKLKRVKKEKKEVKVKKEKKEVKVKKEKKEVKVKKEKKEVKV